MTIPFKTFSRYIQEAGPSSIHLTTNTSQFAEPTANQIPSVADDTYFGGVGFGSAGWGKKNLEPEENPMYRYFNTNISNAAIQTRTAFKLLRATPGLLDDESEEDEDDENSPIGGDRKSFVDKSEEEEGEGEGMSSIPGMNTDALYFGDPGDDETLENIHKAALLKQRRARERWEHMKSWVTSFGLSPEVQSKITTSTTVLGVSTPAILQAMKDQQSSKRETK